MTPDRALAIVFSYLAVACVAWTYGYISRVWIERRTREGETLFVDLTEPAAPNRPAYDWAVDGECREGLTR